MKHHTYTDPYKTLGIDYTATAADIKKAYFAMVREHPPETDTANFKRIRAAYEQLRDPEKRMETDMLIPRRWTNPERKRRPPKLDTTVHVEDILLTTYALSDLERKNWEDQFESVKL